MNSETPETGIDIIRKHLCLEIDFERWPNAYQSLAKHIDTVKRRNRKLEEALQLCYGMLDLYNQQFPSFDADMCMKERDDLRTQRDYWDARCKDAESHFDEIRTRADKAEAEVAELQWDLGICSTCGGEIFHHIDEPFYDCQKCGQHGEATVIPKLQKARYEFITLKQDVRPLVRLFEKFFMSADDLRTLEIFLAKHPECKSTNP